MSNPSHTSLYSSTNSSTSTLRPRTGRLISYVDDEAIESTAISTSTSSTPPHFPSRGISPNEATIVRSKSTDKPRNARTSKAHLRVSSGSQPPTGGKQTAWEPWGSIQDFASTWLGNEASSSSKDKAGGSFKTPVWMKQDKNYTSKPSAPQWGPTIPTIVNPGVEAIQERQAMVQAKKREALLLASASENRDTLGRFKRRDSDADTTIGTQTDQSEDALVYMHKVSTGDTLSGVIIKYNCQPDLFRKVNRFWPNDNIQTRTHVLVPLDGSTVKGRKVDSPYLSRDLFEPGLDHLAMQDPLKSTSPNGVHNPASTTNLTISSSHLTSEPLSLITSLSEDAELRHDSWAMLPNFKDAVEILRVPRRALGYFPRARRKSNTTLTVSSTTSTPKSSFDKLRHPPTHAAQQSASLNASPVRRPAFPGSRLNSTSGRNRSSSTSGTGGNTFADALRGPGGVGDLRGLRTQMSRPGPADDPLNRKFNQYFPDFLPPPQDMPRTGLFSASTATTGSRNTPRASMDSVRSTRSNSNGSVLAGSEALGGAIEGWVRKMAGATAMGKRERSAAVDRMGDLIELETTSETLSENSNGNGNSDGPGKGHDQESNVTPTAATATATEEALLNERFPVRGRVRNAYATSSSSTLGLAKDD